MNKSTSLDLIIGWTSVSCRAGDSWPEEITNAILKRPEKFLLFISAASMGSDNIRREVQIAYENNKKIIILKLEDVEIPISLKYQLAGIQWTEYGEIQLVHCRIKALGNDLQILTSAENIIFTDQKK